MPAAKAKAATSRAHLDYLQSVLGDESLEPLRQLNALAIVSYLNQCRWAITLGDEAALLRNADCLGRAADAFGLRSLSVNADALSQAVEASCLARLTHAIDLCEDALRLCVLHVTESIPGPDSTHSRLEGSTTAPEAPSVGSHPASRSDERPVST